MFRSRFLRGSTSACRRGRARPLSRHHRPTHLTRAFEEAGIQSGTAEHTTEIYDAIHANVATKADIDALGIEINAVETRLTAEIARVADRTLIRASGVMVVLSARVCAAQLPGGRIIRSRARHATGRRCAWGSSLCAPGGPEFLLSAMK